LKVSCRDIGSVLSTARGHGARELLVRTGRGRVLEQPITVVPACEFTRRISSTGRYPDLYTASPFSNKRRERPRARSAAWAPRWGMAGEESSRTPRRAPAPRRSPALTPTPCFSPSGTFRWLIELLLYEPATHVWGWRHANPDTAALEPTSTADATVERA